MKFDLILVSYNSKKYIEKCFSSILKSDYNLKNIGIYIYDNNSSDNTIELLKNIKEKNKEKFSDFQIIASKKNLGFGIANNEASKLAKGDYLFFLNIDCEIYPDTLKKLEETILEKGNNKVGIYELKQQIYEHPKYYDPISLKTKWASGACMIINRELFRKINGFDDNIFMYCEDVEISYRLRRLGYDILYLKDIPIIHYSYQEAYEFKKSQYVNATVNNLYLRFKYGRIKDIVKGYALYLLFYKDIINNPQIKKDEVLKIKQEVRKNKNKMVFKGIFEYIKRIRYLGSKNNVKFDFRGFDYSGVKDGPFYQIKKIDTNPLVSIIVRTCNRPQVLRETLISLRNQTYKNIEIIVVEDGKDTTSKMLEEEFSDLNIKYLALGKNVGRCKAGNKGLEMATGKYLNFLDDDDLFYEDHVEVLVSELEKSDYQVAYSTAFVTPIVVKSRDPYEYDLLDAYVLLSNEYNPLKLMYNNITPIQSVMFSREVYLNCGGFDPELDLLEDWDLWIRYALKYPFKFVKKTTSIYRIPGDTKDASERAKDMDKYLNKVRSKYKDVKIQTTMGDAVDYFNYIVALSTRPMVVRLDKIKYILKRKK